MSIEEIMAQSPTPRTHSIWNALVNAGSNPVETGRILGAARKMELELNAANDRIKRLEELGHELRECASQLGWTSSDDSRWIERAEAAVEAWDKEDKL